MRRTPAIVIGRLHIVLATELSSPKRKAADGTARLNDGDCKV